MHLLDTAVHNVQILTTNLMGLSLCSKYTTNRYNYMYLFKYVSFNDGNKCTTK